MKNDYIFVVFYLSIISVSLCGSLYTNRLNSNGSFPSDNDYSKQTIFASGNDTNVQGISTSTSTNSTWMNFTFSWGSDTQRIVQGEFQLKLSMKLYDDRITIMMIRVNDDDYNAVDYVGFVFDTNQNGHIDLNDISMGLFADNMTQPSILMDNGFLTFAECIPIQSPHIVSFDADQGYVFTIPCTSPENILIPTKSLSSGSNNFLHVCFYDRDLGGVFVRFLFYIPEGSQ